MLPGPRKPPVIVINSHVAHGAVGGRAAVFALERLGYPVVAVPTVILPWHPGHGRGTRIVTDGERFPRLLADLAAPPWLGETGGVLSGYLGEAAQAEPVAGLVAAVKRANPGARLSARSRHRRCRRPLCARAARRRVPRNAPAARRHRHAQPLRARLSERTRSRRQSGPWRGRRARSPWPRSSSPRPMRRPARPPVCSSPAEACTWSATRCSRRRRTAPAICLPPSISPIASPAKRGPEALTRAVSATYRMVAAAAGAGELPLAAEQDLLVAAPAEVALSRIE